MLLLPPCFMFLITQKPDKKINREKLQFVQSERIH